MDEDTQNCERELLLESQIQSKWIYVAQRTLTNIGVCGVTAALQTKRVTLDVPSDGRVEASEVVVDTPFRSEILIATDVALTDGFSQIGNARLYIRLGCTD